MFLTMIVIFHCLIFNNTDINIINILKDEIDICDNNSRTALMHYMDKLENLEQYGCTYKIDYNVINALYKIDYNNTHYNLLHHSYNHMF